MKLPYPDDKGQTHYPGCWRERGHHNCAVAEIERVMLVNAQLTEKFRHIHIDNGVDDSCAKCGLDIRNEVHQRVRMALEGE